MRRIAVALLAAVLAVGFVAPAALADDASLGRTVDTWADRARTALGPFERAIDRFAKSESRADARKLRTQTQRVLSVVGPYRRAVAAEEASSRRFAAAQRRLVTGLGLLAGALRTYDRGLAQWLSGEGEATAKRTLQSSARRFDAADRTIANSVRILTAG